jgi:hypothetical protein
MWVLNHGRHTPQHYSIIGCFADAWALRARPAAEVVTRQLLRSVGEMSHAILSNAAVPSQEIAHVIGSISPEIDRATIFNYVGAGSLDAPTRTAGVEGQVQAPFRLTPLGWRTPQGHLEHINGTQLLITTIESSEGIRWDLQYDPEVFDRRTIIKLSDMTLEALSGLV